MGMFQFFWSQLLVTPAYPTHSFAGQTVIVTGANTGLGLDAARHIVRLGADKVIIACRSAEKGQKAKASIEESTGRGEGVCEVWELDLSSYDSVKSFASRASKLPRLDCLLENAGIAAAKFDLAEGEEASITVNVISTFLLALLLLPKLKSDAKKFNTTPRLVIVSSQVHQWTNLPEAQTEANVFDELSDETKADMSKRYNASKLLEVFAVREMAPRMKDSGVVLNMLNPGFCVSELHRDAPSWGFSLMRWTLGRTQEVGSRTLVASAAAGPESHGKYMHDGLVNEGCVSTFVTSEQGKKTQEKVWKELTERLEKIQPGIMENLST